jgi:hypothetical protein
MPDIEGIIMTRHIASGLLVLAVAACHPAGSHPHAASAQNAGKDVTIDVQGGRMDCSNTMVTGFYDLSREAFAAGPDKVDLEAYKQKTFAMMRADILKEGGSEKDVEGWIDHVKDIPRQMIGIVKDDPKVLETCEKFSIALSGPA